MNTKTPTIIFSVHRKDQSISVNESSLRSAKSVLKVRGIPYFEAQGCYKGEFDGFSTREPSFVLQDIAENLATVRQLARWHRQESIMRIDANSAAYLESPKGEFMTELGQFRSVSQIVAEKLQSWTLCNGQYWVASC